MSDRQQIYDRIRALGSKDKMILQEMIRKGFWKPGSAETAMPEALLAREAELLTELRSLNAKQQVYADRDKALKAMRHERLRVSREKQKETKARREQRGERHGRRPGRNARPMRSSISATMPRTA